MSEADLDRLKARLNQGMEVKGVTAKRVTKVSVRTNGAGTKAIDV